MRFDKFLPSPALRPYIKYYVISEHSGEKTYKVFPPTNLVIGFQYYGKLTMLSDDLEKPLDPSGITGIIDEYRIFRHTTAIGTVLIYFTEVGISYFSKCPANELFGQSISLDHIFAKPKVAETEERLGLSTTDQERISIIESLLFSQLKQRKDDLMVTEAVKLIYGAKGNLRIKDLSSVLSVSQSPFEKRFRKTVGTSAKKFASIVRFHSVLEQLQWNKPFNEIIFEHNFFDQAHFIKDFRKYTGDTPENFRLSF